MNYPFSVHIRLTAAEREIFRLQITDTGLSMSRYLARVVTEKRYPPSLKDREALFRTRFLLEKASGNLNQIAHRLNAAARGAPVVVPTLVEIRQIARTVKAVSLEVKRRLK